jgi:hypothetical protein
LPSSPTVAHELGITTADEKGFATHQRPRDNVKIRLNIMDGTLVFWKLVAIFVASVLGAIGILVDFKDKQGKVTTWGKIVFAIIVISFGIAVYVQLLETSEEDRSEKSAVERSEALLKNLNRLLQPIHNIKVSYNTPQNLDQQLR